MLNRPLGRKDKKMSENQLPVNLMERLASVDNKLEKLLISQPVINKPGLTGTRNPAAASSSKAILPNAWEDDDIPEEFDDAAPSKNPLKLKTTISAAEADTILQKVQKINSDAEILERVTKLERQYRKITILGSMAMTLMVLMLGVFIFLMVHGNRGIFFQASQPGEPPKSFSMEAATKANSPQPAEPVAKVNSPKLAEPVAKVNDLNAAKPVAMGGELKSVEPAVPIAEPQKTETIAPVKFVGSITSNRYHNPDCKWAAQIRPDKLRTFSSVKEAREMGYIPCPTCKPPESDE
jgi:hypothetical protein